MFAQIFQSDVLRYALPGDPEITNTSPDYYPELIMPPRIYAEELAAIDAVFVNRETIADADFVIHVVGTTHQIYYPSYNFIDWRFNGMTGAYIDRRVGLTGTLYDYQIHPARDGSLWRVSILGSFFEIDPVTFEEIADTRQAAAKYGAIILDLPLVDRSQNLVVMKTNLESNQSVGVYDFTSGALIRRINVSGNPKDIFAEDNRRCYVLTTENMVNLIDFTTGEILSTLKAPPVEAGALGSLLTWDRYLRRFLRFTWRANAADGASLSDIAGYYPIPIAIGISKAIPLWPPRIGRTVPCLTRAFGDAGEAIPGVKLEAVVTGATAALAPPATDNDGEALIHVACTAAGAATLDLTATV